MARRLRFHLPSTIYHVMLRGNNGQPIFFSDEDRCRMCLLIQQGVERFGHSIHSFCLMTNHVHLAIKVGNVSISRIVQNLAFRYTRYINKKQNRIGHLFQGRFKSVIVNEQQYLKELSRYIHLNPVRAKLVKRPETYVWSSYRAYLFLDDISWLTRDNTLQNFGSTINEAIFKYESFVLKGIGSEAELDFKVGSSNGILGDEEFVEDFLENVEGIQNTKIELPDLISLLCNRYGISEATLRAPGKYRVGSHVRAILSLFVREIDGLSIEELAKYLNRESSGLSKLATRLENKYTHIPKLAAELNELRKLIYDFQMSECQA